MHIAVPPCLSCARPIDSLLHVDFHKTILVCFWLSSPCAHCDERWAHECAATIQNHLANSRPSLSRSGRERVLVRCPTTNYCRRDDWDFSLVPWRTRMTLNFLHFANAAAVAAAMAAQARSILFVHRLMHFMCGEKDTHKRNFTCGWNSKLPTRIESIEFAICFGILFSWKIVKQFIGQWITVFYFRFVVSCFSGRSNRSSGILRSKSFQSLDTFSIFGRKRNPNNGARGMRFDTKLKPIRAHTHTRPSIVGHNDRTLIIKRE